jgi:uncharacterized protein (TIGR03083 family)
MTLSREEITPGIVAELGLFRDLLLSLDDKEWTTPSRCQGWTCADVAAHVVGSMADVTAGRFDGLGTPEVTQREVDERRGQSPAQLAEELEGVTKASADLLAVFDDAAWNGPAPGGFDGTLGQGVEALWFDTYLHGDDIRAVLGRETPRGPGLRAGVHHVAAEMGKLGWIGTVALDGIEEITVGAGGPRVTGDPFAFLLAGTGRADAAAPGFPGVPNIYA